MIIRGPRLLEAEAAGKMLRTVIEDRRLQGHCLRVTPMALTSRDRLCLAMRYIHTLTKRLASSYHSEVLLC